MTIKLNMAVTVTNRRYEVGQGEILRMSKRIDFARDVTKCPPHHRNVRYKKLKKQESPLVTSKWIADIHNICNTHRLLVYFNLTIKLFAATTEAATT